MNFIDSNIKFGGVGLFPTETIYGIYVDSFNNVAIDALFRFKLRSRDVPFGMYIASLNDIFLLVDIDDISNDTLVLAKYFWPGPLTIILNKKKNNFNFDDKSTVAVRFPDYNLLSHLLKHSSGLVGTSANKHMGSNETALKDINITIRNNVDCILVQDRLLMGVESTVISCVEKPIILREGAISAKSINYLLKI